MKNNKYLVRKVFCLLMLLLMFAGAVQGYLFYYSQKSLGTALFLSLLLASPVAFLFVWYFFFPLNEILATIKNLITNQLDKWPKFFGPQELRRQMRELFHIISEQRKQAAELNKEKRYLEAVLNGIGEGVLVADEQGRLLMINQALRQLLSLPANARAQIPLEIVRHVGLEEAIKKTVQDGQKRSFEFTPPLSQRTFRVNVVGFSLSLIGEQEGRGQVKGAIATFHDISRLQELERIRQDFVANVSHELRTPLATIKGYVETLLEGALRENVAEQFIQVIKKHTDRLIKIVEDLLTLSRIESKEFQMQVERINLADLIEEVLGLIRAVADKKRISLNTQDIHPALWVFADSHYLELVFLNLLDNAIKYSPEGSTVKIKTLALDEEYAQITIQDTGIGIPREDLPRIFERFYRVEKGRSKEYEGTGLGLSIVKHIIQALQGKVWAESELGKGSTFHFILPRKPLADSYSNAR